MKQTTAKQFLKIIHYNCLQCMGGAKNEVIECTCRPDNNIGYKCPFWPYRMGKDPKSKKNAEE